MRIAVWNTAFLGDSVLTLPLLRVLKARYPDAELDFYVRGGLASLYEAQPELAHVYACDKRGSQKGAAAVFRQAREIRARRYDLWVDAHLSLRSSVMAMASGAPRRIGYREAALSALAFTSRVGRRFYDFQEVERLLLLAKAADVPDSLVSDPGLAWPQMRLPRDAEEKAGSLLSVLPEGPLVGVHPGSVWPTKRWLPEGFAHVVRRALDEGCRVVLFSGPGEEGMAREVACLSGAGGECFLDLAGKTSLTVLAALLARLDCYVCNDSGAMHIAWAQHTPVTAIFGPTVRKLGFWPRGAESSVMEADLPCRPCGLHGHRECPQGHFGCMRNVCPEDVWQDVRAKLQKRLALRQNEH